MSEIDITALRRKDEIEAKKKRVEEMRRKRQAIEGSITTVAEVANPEVRQVDPINALDSVPILLATQSAQANVENSPKVSKLAPTQTATIHSVDTVLNAVVSFDSKAETANMISNQSTSATIAIKPDLHIFKLAAIVLDKEIQTDADVVKSEENMIEVGKNRSNSPNPFQYASPPSKDCFEESTCKDHTLSSAPRTLSDNELEAIERSKFFLDFLNQSSKVIERTLAAEAGAADVTADYRNDMSSSQSKSRNRDGESTHGGLSALPTLSAEHITGRPVMCLQFSPHFPELFLVGYGALGGALAGASVDQEMQTLFEEASTASRYAPGLLCIWTTSMHSRPEFTLSAPSPVLAATFHPSHSNLVVGACYNGQIVVWDLRSGSIQPVRQTPLYDGSRRGHEYPVYTLLPKIDSTESFGVHGSRTEDIILSVALDGTICHWNLQHLDSGPALSSHIHASLEKADKPSAAETAAASGIPESLATELAGVRVAARLSDGEILLGSHTGLLYLLPPRALRVDLSMAQGEHLRTHLHVPSFPIGMVSCMHMHPTNNERREIKDLDIFRHLLLTASCFDWSFRLWAVRSPHDHVNNGSFASPLLEFHLADYGCVCDIQWSPRNPAVFACITTRGDLHIWNLAVSVLAPVDSLAIKYKASIENVTGEETSSSADHSATESPVLHKLVWANDGRTIAIGAVNGWVHVVAVNISAFAIQDSDMFNVTMAIKNNSQFMST